jgi:hypothetical protein
MFDFPVFVIFKELIYGSSNALPTLLTNNPKRYRIMERYKFFRTISGKQKFFFYLNCVVPGINKKHIGLGRYQHTGIHDMEFEFDIKAIGVWLKLSIRVQTRRVDIVRDDHFRFGRDQGNRTDAGPEPEFRNMSTLSRKSF